MAQDRAAHDREVRIGPQEIVGEELDEVEQLRKCGPVDFHGSVFSVEDDTVFIVVYIGRVLKAPFFSLDSNWNNAVVFPGGMIGSARVAFIFHTELAFRIGEQTLPFRQPR